MKLTVQDKQRMQLAGEKERYSIVNYFKSIESNKYTYKPMATDSNLSIGYDALILVRDILTGNTVKYIILEAKVRTQDFDTWYLEEKKLKTLKRERVKFIKQNYIQKKIPVHIMYINFTPTKTILWDLDKLEKKNQLGKLESTEMNMYTVQGNTNKVFKKRYELEPKYGKTFEYTYTIPKHIEKLKEEIKVKEEQITGLGAWLFGQKTNDRIKKYNNKL